MRGGDLNQQGAMWRYVSMEQRIPADCRHSPAPCGWMPLPIGHNLLQELAALSRVAAAVG